MNSNAVARPSGEEVPTCPEPRRRAGAHAAASVLTVPRKCHFHFRDDNGSQMLPVCGPPTPPSLPYVYRPDREPQNR